ncbi:hypothetical protein Q9R35_00840 [Alcaligenes sp. AB3]|uniref:hypothetical protein n=1 Tax=Alcaligenes sp. AB3 TaxID=2962569 RepID=UPI002880FE2D|nr:hypothetical protein [Alcaligenes sp. AB3]MDT0215857.1 hypothetical protein [Alcaligenes sp. AB3]
MSDLSLWLQAHEIRRKHTYYLLSVTGLCIGYAIAKPLGFHHWGYAVLYSLALACWAWGIRSGCVYLQQTADLYFSEFHAQSATESERKHLTQYSNAKAQKSLKSYQQQLSCLWLGTFAFGTAYILALISKSLGLT